MLSSYAARDHRVNLKKQRRFDSEFPRASQEPDDEMYMATSPIRTDIFRRQQSAIAESHDECHDVLS